MSFSCKKLWYFLIPFLIVFFLPWNPVQSQESKKGHPKIESGLSDLKEMHSYGRTMSLTSERGGLQFGEEEKVVVFILPERGKGKETIDIDTLKLHGCEVIKSGDSVIKAKVPISMLDLIADSVEGISFIKPPDRPVVDFVSEGVALTGSLTYHSAGNEGQNVKVAIIDLGFAGLSEAIAGGEVPTSVIKVDCTGSSCVNTDFSVESEPHGTAVGEVVHDMAPQAQLYLIKINDNLDLRDAKDYCIVNGIRIINHSVGWFSANYGDGACYFDNAVCTANHAYKNGILWVNSAGNHARRHYAAVFTDRDGDRLHNVTEENNFIAINAQAGGVILATLTWDAWPVTNQDYDLELYDSSRNRIIGAGGGGWQTGTQPPWEEISYFVPDSGTYYLAVKNYGATVNHRFQIFSLTYDLNPSVPAGSLLSPSDASGVMAVAAIDQSDWSNGPQESFSSQGPTSDGRMKPDISGPDGVSNSVYGSFFGTSASSPHVAGAAAVILSQNPALGVDQLWEALISSAIDLGPSGKDTRYGQGRLNLAPFEPSIYAVPAPLNFEEIIVGISSDKLLTLRNDGNANLVLGSITAPASPFRIVGDTCSGKTLSYEEICTLTIRFSPQGAGAFSSILQIPSNDPLRNLLTVSLNGGGRFNIMLSFPTDQASYGNGSASPAFSLWDVTQPFLKYEIQFSSNRDFSDIPFKVRVPGNTTAKTLTSNQWRRVLSIPGENGGTVYWRVMGTEKGGLVANSDIRSIMVLPPLPVGDPALAPASKTGLTTLTWQNNSNTKFRVWFGSDGSFTAKRSLTFYSSSSGEAAFSRQLTSSQWMSIRRLGGDESGKAIFWYVESWDSLNRHSTSEIMSFILTD